MSIRIKNFYQIRFVLVAIAFMALGWLLASPLLQEQRAIYIGVIVVAAIVLLRLLVWMLNFVPTQVNYFLQEMLKLKPLFLEVKYPLLQWLTQ